MVLDFSLVTSGGSSTHASGFLGALASMEDPPSDLLVCLPGDDSLLVAEEAELRMASVPTIRIGSRRRAGSWPSRISGQVSLPRLCFRLRPSAVLIPREVGPVLLRAPSVLLAANVLRWGVQPGVDDPLAVQPPTRVRMVAGVKTWVARRAVSRASAVIAPSRVVADLLPPHERVEVIPFGIDVPAVDPDPSPIGVRRPLRVVVLSSIARHKRLDVVVDLVAELRSVHGIDARLDIWGGGGQAEVEAKLGEQMATRLGEAGRMRGPLHRADRSAMLAGADVLAAGSGVESFGFPLLEAQKSATLVLAPDAAIVREQCGDRAVTYPAGDPVAGAARLADALGRGRAEEMRSRLKAGVVHASTYTWERCAEETLDLLAEVTRA